MKIFTLKFILFIAIFIAYCSFNYLLNLRFIAVNPPIIRASSLLIAGDSHAQLALNPKAFYNATNISQPGEPYSVTFWKLKKIIKCNTVSTLIIGFSPHNFSQFYDNRFADPQKSNKIFERIYSITNSHTFVDFQFDPTTYYRVCAKLMCLYPHKNHIAYIQQPNVSEISDISNFDQRIRLHYYIDNKEALLSQLSVNYLDSIKVLCSNSNIDMRLIYTPLHSEYVKRIPLKFSSGFDSISHQLTNQGFHIFHSKQHFDDSDFKDADHLNYVGAQKFSEEVDQYLRIDSN
jgi:hypothetical protein